VKSKIQGASEFIGAHQARQLHFDHLS